VFDSSSPKSVSAHSEKRLPARVSPANTFFLAVDGDAGTAWQPGRSPLAGDFIGLDLLSPSLVRGVSLLWSGLAERSGWHREAAAAALSKG
jgi:hypothetical protein